MISYTVMLILLCLIVGALGQKSCINENRCTLDHKELKFSTFGDWGGVPVWPYYSKAQKIVAKGLGDLAQREKMDFILSLGDHFYWVGVENDADSRFKSTFENIYVHSSLKTVPWYMMAGNHDHLGNISAQIAYTKNSNRWIFPNLYYTIKYRLANRVDIDIVVIDTVILCGKSKDGEFYSNWQYLFSSSEKPYGPRDRAAAENQWRWIEEQLKKSRAHYLLVAGHYPIYSTADHGPTQCLVDRLKPLLQKYKVPVYLSGHDHNLQHLKIDDRGFIVHQIVSGAGAFTTKSESNAKNVPQGSSIFVYPEVKWYNVINPGKIGFGTKGGFVTVRMDEARSEFIFYKGNLDILHSFSVKPRDLSTLERFRREIVTYYVK